MADPQTTEKPMAGWIGGCNSLINPWLLPQNQYSWGVNIVNRGGIIQTRPGKQIKLTLPEGNLQGAAYFEYNRERDTPKPYIVFAVDGVIYQYPIPENNVWVQPKNATEWYGYRLTGLTFRKNAAKIFFCSAVKQTGTTRNGDLSIVTGGSYNVLMIQDGVTNCGYWDGVEQGHLNPSAPSYQTLPGTWMEYSGGRLWVARDNNVVYSDLGDPLTMLERTKTDTGGDVVLQYPCTGLRNYQSPTSNQQRGILYVFTRKNTKTVASYITDSTLWATTTGFVSDVYTNIGCVAGRSIVNYSGLLWWFSNGGVISSDAAAAANLTSRIRYRDTEMTRSKSGLADDLSSICAGSIESYLLMSVPNNDVLNSHTWVLDYSTADQLNSQQPPAWNGVWTGTRPIEYITGEPFEVPRLFNASIDYVAQGGSFNHIWEEFMPDRTDSYYDVDPATQETYLRHNPIYCCLETARAGDGMALKTFKYTEIDLMELGGTINFKVSYAGTRGGWKRVLNRTLVANLTASEITGANGNAITAFEQLYGPFRVQTRRIRTNEVTTAPSLKRSDESIRTENIDKCFSLRLEWCGRAGIDSLRMEVGAYTEPTIGQADTDEVAPRVVTIDGRSPDVV